MQRNWIGSSEGTMVNFRQEGHGAPIPIFTTRPDTLFGVTFMVYAPEHPDVLEMVQGTEHEQAVREFVNRIVMQDKFDAQRRGPEKEGMFLGRYAINPLNGEEGADLHRQLRAARNTAPASIMAVPAHDQRDFEFAKKYGIPHQGRDQPAGRDN